MKNKNKIFKHLENLIWTVFAILLISSECKAQDTIIPWNYDFETEIDNPLMLKEPFSLYFDQDKFHCVYRIIDQDTTFYMGTNLFLEISSNWGETYEPYFENEVDTVNVLTLIDASSNYYWYDINDIPFSAIQVDFKQTTQWLMTIQDTIYFDPEIFYPGDWLFMNKTVDDEQGTIDETPYWTFTLYRETLLGYYEWKFIRVLDQL